MEPEAKIKMTLHQEIKRNGKRPRNFSKLKTEKKIRIISEKGYYMIKVLF